MNLSYSKIINSGRVPEANIQAEFYMLCRKSGIRVLLEVKYRNCRFDALVFIEDKPFAIIEVKNYSKKRAAQGFNKKTKQITKYMAQGLPVLGVFTSKHIIPSFNRLCEMINEAQAQHAAQ